VTIIRSGVIGTFMGLVPGVGEDMGAWVSYAVARNASKKKEEYGKGSVEGLMSAETGNSAAVPGAIIPVFTLAIPGSAPAAVLLAALFIHGVRPGPLIMIENPAFVFEVVAMVFYASVAILTFGLLLTKPLLLVLRVSHIRLMPIIFVLCTVGAFAITSRLFDVWVMLAFGVLGFGLRLLGFPMAPLVLGVVLGPILDVNLRRGLVLSDGSLTPFFTRPISLLLVVIIAITFLLGSEWFIKTVGRLTRRRPRSDASVSPAARDAGDRPDGREGRACATCSATRWSASSTSPPSATWPRASATTGSRSPVHARPRAAPALARAWRAAAGRRRRRRARRRAALAAGGARGPVDHLCRRRRPARHARRDRALGELCADLGGRVLVHGSPKQRSCPRATAPARSTAPRRRSPRGARGRGGRRRVLHRAALAPGDRVRQRGGRGRGDRRGESGSPRCAR
jgi:hypothetical protein